MHLNQHAEVTCMSSSLANTVPQFSRLQQRADTDRKRCRRYRDFERSTTGGCHPRACARGKRACARWDARHDAGRYVTVMSALSYRARGGAGGLCSLEYVDDCAF